MTNLLHISASPRGADSHSRKIGRMLVERARGTGGARIIRRDLVEAPPSPPSAAFADASLTPSDAREARHVAALAESERLIAEFEAADAVVFDTPMHNFTVPAVLKAWIDMIVRPNRTFRSTPSGKVGLLANRPVVLVYACGGPVGDQPSDQQDFLAPYLAYVLASIGVVNFAAIRMDGLRRGPEAVEAAEGRAVAALDDAVARLLKPAA